MDASILTAVLPEVREEMVGLAVTKVELVGKHGVLVRLGNARRDLYVSSHPELSRLGLLSAPPVGDAARGPDNLTKPLVGSRLASVEQERGGRVASLRFQTGEATLTLVAELIPRFANVVLVGGDGRILWSRRTFTGDRPRRVVAGVTYRPPAPDPGPRLPDLDRSTIAARIAAGEGPIHGRIPRGWGGGPRGPARVYEEAGLDVVDRLAALADAARVPAPTLVRHEATGRLNLFPADPGSLPGWKTLPPAGPNDVVDRWYREHEESEAAGQLLAELRRTFAKRRSRAAKALRQIEGRIDEAAREADYRRQAELLTAHFGDLKRGMRRVTLPDFDGAQEVRIELDPKLDPRANAEALFKKARRLARGREELESQRRLQDSRIEEADRALARLDPPPDPDRLREIAGELAPSVLRGRSSRLPAAAAEPAAERGSLPPGFWPRRYELPGGWEVWVGRDSRQNDELTHRRASQRDLWFHARGSQGSHTVLRRESGKGEPPKDVILATAAIAAYHSKARRSGLVPVAYTEKRYVRKPRGAPPGTAAMIREKVVMVKPKLPAGVDR